MTPHGLRTVAKLRRFAVLRAQAELARRHAAENETVRAEAAARDGVAREIRAGSTGPGADAFAAWLAAARLHVERVRALRVDAEHAVRQARSDLTAADVAKAALDTLIERRADAARAHAARSDQALIDDMAARRWQR